MEHPTQDEARKGRIFQLWGWALFMISALFFIIASVRSGDWLGLLGGLFFLLANIVFVIPVWKQRWK